MNNRKLKKVSSDSGRSVLDLGKVGPVFRGTGDANYICPSCDSVLAENVIPDHIWDIVLHCHGCETLSEFPRLPYGAIVTGHVFIPSGRCYISGPLDPKTTLIVGEGVIKGGGTTFRP